MKKTVFLFNHDSETSWIVAIQDALDQLKDCQPDAYAQFEPRVVYNPKNGGLAPDEQVSPVYAEDALVFVHGEGGDQDAWLQKLNDGMMKGVLVFVRTRGRAPETDAAARTLVPNPDNRERLHLCKPGMETFKSREGMKFLADLVKPKRQSLQTALPERSIRQPQDQKALSGVALREWLEANARRKPLLEAPPLNLLIALFLACEGYVLVLSDAKLRALLGSDVLNRRETQVQSPTWWDFLQGEHDLVARCWQEWHHDSLGDWMGFQPLLEWLSSQCPSISPDRQRQMVFKAHEALSERLRNDPA